METEPQKTPQLFIGCPVYKDLPLEWVASLQKLMNSRPPYVIITNYFQSCLVHYSRNEIVKNFLARDGCDYLMWIDADMVYEPEDIQKLWDHKLDIVGGLYVKRKPPYHPTPGYCNAKTKWKVQGIGKWDEDKMTEVDFLGTGFMMVHRRVFEKMKEPWFEYRKYKDGYMLGEDTTFCVKAKEAGFKVWLDPSIQVGHIGSYIYTPLDYLAMRKAMEDEHTTRSQPVLSPG